jgi:hypothetical protein
MDKQIIFIRHAQGLYNLGNFNIIDHDLTSNGIKQALSIKDNIIIKDPDIIISDLNTERWSSKCDEGSSKSMLLDIFPFINKWEGFD